MRYKPSRSTREAYFDWTMLVRIVASRLCNEIYGTKKRLRFTAKGQVYLENTRRTRNDYSLIPSSISRCIICKWKKPPQYHGICNLLLGCSNFMNMKNPTKCNNIFNKKWIHCHSRCNQRNNVHTESTTKHWKLGWSTSGCKCR